MAAKSITKKVTKKKSVTPKKASLKATKEVKKVTPKISPPEAIVEKKSQKAANSASEAKKSIVKSGKAPTNMEELLAETGYQIKAPRPGQVISGMVTDVTKKVVLIDIGAKTEGMVVEREFEAARDFIDQLTVGDEVTAYVLTPENERGQILLSLKRALIDKRWEQFAQYMETGEVVEVRGLEVNKGGMIVNAGGIRGFVPSSQFGKEYLGRMEELLDKSFTVKVIEVDKEKNRLIFSERHVSEADAIAKKIEALKYVHEGDTFDGVVSGIMPFGVFAGVEVPIVGKDKTGKGKKDTDALVGKLEGLVHISEISWEKVNDPNDYFKLGDRIKVKVLGVDEAAGKLNLSVKQLSGDPWSTVETKYPIGAKVKGMVTRTAPFGVFVTLEPGIDGLIHISKIPGGAEPIVGKGVDIFVETIDVPHRRMSLGMVLTEVPVAYK